MFGREVVEHRDRGAGRGQISGCERDVANRVAKHRAYRQGVPAGNFIVETRSRAVAGLVDEPLQQEYPRLHRPWRHTDVRKDPGRVALLVFRIWRGQYALKVTARLRLISTKMHGAACNLVTDEQVSPM